MPPLCSNSHATQKRSTPSVRIVKKRFGMMIGLKADRVEGYKRLHDQVWPGVLKALTDNGARNFPIFLKEPENLLFGMTLPRGFSPV